MKLYPAIVVSLLCHSVVLMLWRGDSTPVNVPAPIQAVVVVNDQTQPVTEPPVSKTSPVATRTKTSLNATPSHPTTTLSSNQYVKSESRHVTRHESVQEDIRRHTDHQRRSRQQAQSYVISHLYSRMENYFVYPALARRKGWEGKVILAMHINSGGQVQNVQVKTGSGYPLLDNSAVNALSQIRYIPDLPRWQGSGLLNVDIPVIYRLKS